MGIINLEDLRPDMLLAGDVTARNGRVLLRSGSRLTEKHLGIFKAWGVTEADINGITKDDISDAATQDIDPDVLSQINEDLKKQFRHAGTSHPFLEELFRVCTARIVQKHKD